MKNYEVTFVVDPVLSGDEAKAIAELYTKKITDAGCKIVHIDHMGLRQLAYPINKKASGVYTCIEFSFDKGGDAIADLELTLRRDERVLRFLTVSLDKFGAQYNQDKRDGKIGKKAQAEKAKKAEDAKKAQEEAQA